MSWHCAWLQTCPSAYRVKQPAQDTPAFRCNGRTAIPSLSRTASMRLGIWERRLCQKNSVRAGSWCLRLVSQMVKYQTGSRLIKLPTSGGAQMLGGTEFLQGSCRCASVEPRCCRPALARRCGTGTCFGTTTCHCRRGGRFSETTLPLHVPGAARGHGQDSIPKGRREVVARPQLSCLRTWL